jgi:hypothetical protein
MYHHPLSMQPMYILLHTYIYTCHRRHPQHVVAQHAGPSEPLPLSITDRPWLVHGLSSEVGRGSFDTDSVALLLCSFFASTTQKELRHTRSILARTRAGLD